MLSKNFRGLALFFLFLTYIDVSQARSWGLEEIRSAFLKVTEEAHELGESLVDARLAALALEEYSGTENPLPVIRMGLASYDQLVRQSCVRAIKPTLGPEAIGLMVEILVGKSVAESDPETLEIAARSLWRFAQDSRFPELLNKILLESPINRLDLIAENLEKCGSGCTEGVLTALKSKNHLVRAFALRALRYFDDDLALPLIEKGLKSVEFLETSGASFALIERTNLKALSLIKTAIRLPYYKARIHGYLALSKFPMTREIEELYVFGLKEARRFDRILVLFSLLTRDDFEDTKVQNLLEWVAADRIVPRTELEQIKVTRWRLRDALAEFKGRRNRGKNPSFSLGYLEAFDLEFSKFKSAVGHQDVGGFARLFLENIRNPVDPVATECRRDIQNMGLNTILDKPRSY